MYIYIFIHTYIYIYIYICARENCLEGEARQDRTHQRGHRYEPAEAGSYLRLIDSCITQLKTQGPSRTCNESNEEEYEPA